MKCILVELSPLSRNIQNSNSTIIIYSGMLHFVLQFRIQSSRWAPLLWPKTSKALFGPVNLFSFYLELYQNKFKNLIQTNKFIFSLTVNRRVIILVWMAIEHASLLLCTSHPVNVSYNTNKMFLFNITLTGDFSKWCHKKMRVSYLKNTSNHSVK